MRKHASLKREYKLIAALTAALNQLDALERAYEINTDGRLSGSGLPPPSATPAYKNARAILLRAYGVSETA